MATNVGILVERMIEEPPHCMNCGCGNTPDRNGDIGPFLQMPIQRNFGDSCYLCSICAIAIGAMFGMALPDDIQALEKQVAKRDKKIHQLQTEVELGKRTRQGIQTRLDAALTTKKELKKRQSGKAKAA